MSYNICSANTAEWYARFHTYGSEENFENAVRIDKEKCLKAIDKRIRKAYQKGKYSAEFTSRRFKKSNAELCSTVMDKVAAELRSVGYAVYATSYPSIIPNYSYFTITISWNKKALDLNSCTM